MDVEGSGGTELDVRGSPILELEDYTFYNFWKGALREFNRENFELEMQTIRNEIIPSIYNKAYKLFNKPPIKAFLLLPINSLLENFSVVTTRDLPGGVSRGRLLLAYTKMILHNLVSYRERSG